MNKQSKIHARKSDAEIRKWSHEWNRKGHQKSSKVIKKQSRKNDRETDTFEEKQKAAKEPKSREAKEKMTSIY